jgi:hypothetical protein
MIRSEKKLKELSSLLNKDNNNLIIEAIGLLREEQPFEGAIGLLAAYYNRTDNNTIRKAIENFMNDLKDQTVCTEVIAEINKQWKHNTISMLVASCWQSGLNYSDYSPDFVKIFLKGDYVTAIETLTVIEEMVNKLSQAKKYELIKIINESPVFSINEKSELRNELIAILSGES